MSQSGSSGVITIFNLQICNFITLLISAIFLVTYQLNNYTHERAQISDQKITSHQTLSDFCCHSMYLYPIHFA